MSFQSIIVKETEKSLTIQFNRLDNQNSISSQLLTEMDQALDQAEKNHSCRLVILEGQQGIFCTGMDFKEMSGSLNNPDHLQQFSAKYMLLLKRLAHIPKVVISKIDGKVIAGGVGFAAASDLIIATEKSQFSLSEALWGLLPANVIPYLIRRVGFQKAYMMTLTTRIVTGQEALQIGLVDELSANLEDSVRKLSLRLNILEESTLKNLKAYFRKMWIIDEEIEKHASDELTHLLKEPTVQANIKNYAEHGKTPWG